MIAAEDNNCAAVCDKEDILNFDNNKNDVEKQKSVALCQFTCESCGNVWYFQKGKLPGSCTKCLSEDTPAGSESNKLDGRQSEHEYQTLVASYETTSPVTSTSHGRSISEDFEGACRVHIDFKIP